MHLARASPAGRARRVRRAPPGAVGHGMASPFVELEVGSRTVKVTNPDKVLFPDAGHTKRDLVDYYLAVGDGIVRALRERPTQLRRFPDGIAGEQIYQKRVPREAAGVGRGRARHVSLRPPRRRALRHRARAGDLGREPRGDRLPPVALATRGRRPARRAADRRRPAAGHDVRGREAGRRRRARDARRDRLHGLAEDLRQPRNPHRGADRAALGVPRRPPLRARLRAGDRAPRARPRHDGVVEGGARREGVHRLQPERPRPDDRIGILGAAAARRDRVGAGHVGRAARRRDRGLHARHDAGAVREARRRAGGDRRRRLRPRGAARVGRARGGRGRGRGAVPAELPEDARRAAAGAALAREEAREPDDGGLRFPN